MTSQLRPRQRNENSLYSANGLSLRAALGLVSCAISSAATAHIVVAAACCSYVCASPPAAAIMNSHERLSAESNRRLQVILHPERLKLLDLAQINQEIINAEKVLSPPPSTLHFANGCLRL